METKYIDKVTIKLFIALILTIIAIPYWFYAGGTILGFIAVRLVAMMIQGISTIGIHRWLCHNTFKPNKFGKYLMLTGIVLSGLGKPLHYVLSHVLHHRHTDTELDPQSPKYLTFWELAFGRLRVNSGFSVPKHVLRDKEVMFVNNHYWKLYFAFNLLLAVIHLPTALIFCPVTLVIGWGAATYLNYYGHNGQDVKNIGPQNLSHALNLFAPSGEELHKNHHDNPSSYHYDGNGRKDVMRWFIERVLMK
jgi:stearoyl-CoA desaturase (delta-9 desaturase)